MNIYMLYYLLYMSIVFVNAHTCREIQALQLEVDIAWVQTIHTAYFCSNALHAASRKLFAHSQRQEKTDINVQQKVPSMLKRELNNNYD